MGAKNEVIAGDYKNCSVTKTFGLDSIYIITSGGKSINLNKSNICNYEVINQTSNKSATSAIGRGALGVALLGPVGLLAGLSAKSKGTHVVAIEFKDGKKSLIEIDDKYYKILLQSLF